MVLLGHFFGPGLGAAADEGLGGVAAGDEEEQERAEEEGAVDDGGEDLEGVEDQPCGGLACEQAEDGGAEADVQPNLAGTFGEVADCDVLEVERLAVGAHGIQ